jgi:hypothetical protein
MEASMSATASLPCVLPAVVLAEQSVASMPNQVQPAFNDNGMVVLLVLFVSTGLLLTALSVPLILRKIPPNYLYGFRVKATLENEEVWYPANEYAAKRLLWVGLGTVVTAVVLFLLPIRNVGVYASAVGGVVMVGLTVAVVQSFLYLRTFTDVQ